MLLLFIYLSISKDKGLLKYLVLTCTMKSFVPLAHCFINTAQNILKQKSTPVAGSGSSAEVFLGPYTWHVIITPFPLPFSPLKTKNQ